MSRKQIAVLLVVVFALTSMVAGCGFFGKTKQDSKYLRYALGAEPETLDPRKSTSIPASTAQAQLFEGLTTLDANNNPVPAAAERWDISPDGLAYIFYLRQSAKWANGEPVTARDFEYTWKSVLSPELASSNAYQLFYLKNGEAYNNKRASVDQVGVRAVSDYVLEVKLEKPAPYFLTLAAFHAYYPVNQKVASSNEKWAADPSTLIGNGPFKAVRWVHDNKLELVKNDAYWDAAKVKMAKLDLILVSSNTTVLSMFDSGQVDMGENPPVSDFPRLNQEKKMQFSPFLGVDYYTFNVKKAPFDNAKVRKAFTLAIDRQTIIDQVLKGGQKAALAFVPYGMPDAAPGEDFRTKGGQYFQDNDVASAQRLLAEAGFPGGQGLPLITLLYNSNENNKMIAEAVQEMWRKNLGVTVQLNNQEWKVYLDTLDKRTYQVARDNWVGDYVDAMTFMDLFESTSGNNVPGYSNSQYDKLIETAKSTPDQAVRMKAMHDAEKMLMDGAVIMPIYFKTNPAMVKSNVKGYVRAITGVTYFKEAYME